MRGRLPSPATVVALRPAGGEPLYGMVSSTADADSETCTAFGWTLTR